MRFGRLENVDHIDWTLPGDDPLSAEFLSRRKSGERIKIHFGGPAWAHASWAGKIYPEDAKRNDYLSYYSRAFSCIELNTVHYAIPSDAQVEAWLKQVPPGFLFLPKVFQGISHSPHGLLDQKVLKQWFHFIDLFGSHLGPCFIQMPPHFTYAMKAELFTFLKNWPAKYPLALELRHPSWFEGPRILPGLAKYLQERGIALVITDTAGRRDVLHTTISADFVFLRFVGSNLHVSDRPRAKDWAQRIKRWEEQGLKELYLLIHEPDDIFVPEMTDIFLEELQNAGGWTFEREKPAQKSQLSLI